VFKYLNGLPRYLKAVMLLTIDVFLIIIAYYFALVLRLNDLFPEFWITRSLNTVVITIIIAVILAPLMKLHLIKLSAYDGTAQIRTAIWIFMVAGVATVANAFLGLGAPRTVPIIFGIVSFVLISGSRYAILNGLNYIQSLGQQDAAMPVAIYGAGASGRQLLASLKGSPHFRPAFFIDDNKSFEGTIISGLKVVTPDTLEKNMVAYNISKIFLAMPSLTKVRKDNMLQFLKQFNCEVQELPSFVELIETGDVLKSLRPVEPDDLLGREKIEFNLPELADVYADQTIFVSGAGGSIGSELCRQVVEIGPKKLILFELTEFALYKIERELDPIAKAKGIELVSILGSVLDANKIDSVFAMHKPTIVLHTAAYKHVPLIETNEIEAGRNNIFGTKVLGEACLAHNVLRFTLISTDKAVRPTNVMGASKRFAELVVQGFSEQKDKTVFSIVRFGNVLGSSGSVIPLFKEQIANGGPVTLTNLNITRYFMTIPEAARLVLIAGSFAEGGEVFVLDMGEPVQIKDLARKIINLSGLTVKDKDNPDGDIEIEIVGLRPGEKLYEELFIGEETLPTNHAKILRAREKSLPKAKLNKAMKTVDKIFDDNNALKFREFLTNYVEGYKGNFDSDM